MVQIKSPTLVVRQGCAFICETRWECRLPLGSLRHSLLCLEFRLLHKRFLRLGCHRSSLWSCEGWVSWESLLIHVGHSCSLSSLSGEYSSSCFWRALSSLAFHLASCSAYSASCFLSLLDECLRVDTFKAMPWTIWWWTLDKELLFDLWAASMMPSASLVVMFPI